MKTISKKFDFSDPWASEHLSQALSSGQTKSISGTGGGHGRGSSNVIPIGATRLWTNYYLDSLM